MRFDVFRTILFSIAVLAPLSWAQAAPASATPLPESTLSTTIEEAESSYQLTRRQSFTPHLTIDAKTREPGKVSFEPGPGSNINTNVLASSFVVAVYHRVELGTVPLFYVAGTKQSNYSAKVNFWRGAAADWSIGASVMEFDLGVLPGFANDLKFQTTTLQLANNLRPSWTRWSFGFADTVSVSRITGDPLIQALTIRTANDLAVDASYPLARSLDMTLGLGSMRDEGYTAYEEAHLGGGVSFAWFRPGHFFSKPGVGVNFVPALQSWKFLFSTEFD